MNTLKRNKSNVYYVQDWLKVAKIILLHDAKSQMEVIEIYLKAEELLLLMSLRAHRSYHFKNKFINY